jgi:hypothetical protein
MNSFFGRITLLVILLIAVLGLLKSQAQVYVRNLKTENRTNPLGIDGHVFNGWYAGANADHIAFPIGGMGAGMFCLEGTGAISHMSVENKPDLNNEPLLFAAIAVREMPGGARVLEGPVPVWKKFGQPKAGATGNCGKDYGLPRFGSSRFRARFPFATVELNDQRLPLAVTLTGWSPFIPTKLAEI